MTVFRGGTHGTGRRVALVEARFNSFVTGLLHEGAVRALEDAGVDPADLDTYYVPGAWELPQIAGRLARAGGHDAIVALGCVIRGETAHFDYVAGEAARGLRQVAVQTGVPVIFGVLTTDTVEQALERADPEAGNKGGEVAAAALEMASLVEQIEDGRR